MTEHEFILWLTRMAFANDWRENGESYQELILRKLEKVGAVSIRNGTYEIEDKYDCKLRPR